MKYNKEDLVNTVNRSELKGENLEVIHVMGDDLPDGSWQGGFILGREDGTFAVIEGWTGPEGWKVDAECGYDLRIVKELTDAFDIANDKTVFEVLDADPSKWEAGTAELEAELDKYIGPRDPKDPRPKPKLEIVKADTDAIVDEK